MKRNVDQSIQLGDGSWGITASTEMYKVVKRATLFASGIYLSNPRGTNGVTTGRSRPSEAIMSVADQYLVQAGVTYPVPMTKRFLFSAGGRMEGVPVRDIFGSSEGFRRPGYVISFDPGVTYVRGRNTMSVNVPVPLERNRRRSGREIKEHHEQGA